MGLGVLFHMCYEGECAEGFASTDWVAYDANGAACNEFTTRGVMLGVATVHPFFMSSA
jgi:hypothetical protein